MSLKSALGSEPDAPRRWFPRALVAAALGASAVSACGKPEERVVARFVEAPTADAGGSNAGGADAGQGQTIPIPRDRVKVVDGKLVTDLGTPLRAMVLNVDIDWRLADYDITLLQSIAETTGVNTLHIYLENSSQVAGVNQAEADKIVYAAALAGLYVVIAMGTGSNVGSFDQSKITAFWKHYAPLYANNTHVLYEIQNNPEDYPCGSLMLQKTIDMERTSYQAIRALAPKTHILLFSTTRIPTVNVVSDAITRLGTSIDWSTASIALGLTTAADCLALQDFPQLTAAVSASKVPLVISELPSDGWAPYVQMFEQQQVGWMQFRWLVFNKDAASFRSAVTAAGVSWCPERGIFPEDASRCSH